MAPRNGFTPELVQADWSIAANGPGYRGEVFAGGSHRFFQLAYRVATSLPQPPYQA